MSNSSETTMKRFFNFIPASPTSLRFKYRDEAALLAKSLNPEQEYVEHVLPDKIKLAPSLFPKFEIRISKSETISKFEILKFKTQVRFEIVWNIGSFCHLILFRASDFVLRI